MAPPQRQEARPPGNACVWVVAALLLLAVLAGGGCLMLYLTLPPDNVPHWLPAAGLALVAFPWAFWIATCAYRCCCSSAAAGAVERQPSRTAAVAPLPSSKSLKSALGSASAKHDRSPVASPGGERRVHFGNATVLGAEGAGSGAGLAADDDLSVDSHESEAPLAYSMHSS